VADRIMEQQPALGFAGLLRRLRGEAKLTQEELAQAAGISARSVSDLERGINRTARKDTALLLADALNLAEPARAVFIAAARGRVPAQEVLTAMSAGTQQASPAASRLDPRAAQPWLVPAQLPLDVAGFTGRERELEQLESLAVARADNAMAICVIDGTAGIGKTALAVRFAHHVAGQFEDGQLYVNLRGFDPRQPPLPAEEALRGFLHALGVHPGRIPFDIAELEGVYRSLVAGRRILVVLDNAASVDHVRPLLPGTQTCMVLVTSRNRLGGLAARDGARRITLDILPHDEAMALLAWTIGRERVTAERDASDAVTGLCGRLPLALRVAAEWAAAHPSSPLSELAARLSDERTRLGVLATDDDETTAVRPVLSSSYRSLAPDAARAFRLLALHAGPEFSVLATSALLAVSSADARRLLEALTSQHLTQEGQPGRYRFHDLLRLYAAERAEDDEAPADRADAVRRVLGWYLQTANATDIVLIPQRLRPPRETLPGIAPEIAFSARDDALDWCEAECANIIAAVSQAADVGQYDTAWKLCMALTGFFYLRKHWAYQISAYRIGLRTARQAGNEYGETWILINLGIACRELGRFDEALQQFQAALTIAQKTGDAWAEGYAQTNIGDTHHAVQRFENAADHYLRALAIAQEIEQRTGQDPGQDITLTSLANTYRSLSRFDDALHCSGRALAIARENGDQWGEGFAYHSLGDTLRDLGQLREATDHLRQGLIIREEIGDQHGQARILHSLGGVLRDAGQIDAAYTAWSQAIAIFYDLGDSPQAELLAADLRTLSPKNLALDK
jgi:tetratricopeptide (TPR) repeat protein/transcriptional regulator with XRE-family HTH domain